MFLSRRSRRYRLRAHSLLTTPTSLRAHLDPAVCRTVAVHDRGNLFVDRAVVAVGTPDAATVQCLRPMASRSVSVSSHRSRIGDRRNAVRQHRKTAGLARQHFLFVVSLAFSAATLRGDRGKPGGLRSVDFLRSIDHGAFLPYTHRRQSGQLLPLRNADAAPSAHARIKTTGGFSGVARESESDHPFRPATSGA